MASAIQVVGSPLALRQHTPTQTGLGNAGGGVMYDRARFREEEGLPQKTRRFDAIARECCKALEQEIERASI